MTQEERRRWLIGRFLSEDAGYEGTEIPESAAGQRLLLRGLMNVRPPRYADDELLAVQNEYLKNEIAAAGVTDIETLKPVEDGVYLWQGDITTLRCGAIVNAANSGMLGCFVPNHRCIDNAIHTFAGVQLRGECAGIMAAQGHEEPAGGAKITSAGNLPCRYILHTVGPIIYGEPSEEDERLLASCYRSCLELAERNGIESVAFCCISTGEFRFPNRRAAEIAVDTVRKYREYSSIRVIFNVFKDMDREIYESLLGRRQKR